MGFYDHYSKRDRNRFGFMLKLKQNKKIFKYGLKQFKGNPRILELGPGDGQIAKFCKEQKLDYLGIEGSEAVYRNLKEQNYRVIQHKFPPLPSIDEKFDICYYLHVIEHMNNLDEIELTLKNIHSLLNEGGIIAIATPDYLKWGKHFFNSDYSHNFPFTKRRLYQLMNNADFDILQCSHYVGTVFNKKSILLHLILKYTYSSFLDDIFSKKSYNSLWYRIYLTFLPNLLFIARKKSTNL